MAKMNDEYFEEVLAKAQEAAQKAGDEWMANATPKYVVRGYEDSPMLDLCGNAHIRVYDGRTKFYKYLVKTYGKHLSFITVPLNTTYSGRQEYGLKMAIASAALNVLSGAGIKKLRLWDYID